MNDKGNQIQIQPVNEADFAKFGDILTLRQKPDQIINQGMCNRHNDLAKLTFADGGKDGISLFDAEPQTLPLKLEMMERHPKGSQAFVPMHELQFLVIVAGDKNGQPDIPKAFLTDPRTGINIHQNIWHGVLTPINTPGLFAVIDWIGNETNLEEYWFKNAYTIVR